MCIVEVDCFRIGNCFGKRRCKLYSDFYNSDLILASPLALRQLEEKRGFDYLSSIEIGIIYGMDMICMQNVDHLRGVVDALNHTISRDRNTDFSRLREYYLSDFQKYMRQTIFVGKIVNSTILGLFHRSCFNTLVRIYGSLNVVGSFRNPSLLRRGCKRHSGNRCRCSQL